MTIGDGIVVAAAWAFATASLFAPGLGLPMLFGMFAACTVTGAVMRR